MRTIRIGLLCLAVLSAASRVFAQETTYMGTVMAVEAERVQIMTAEPQAKHLWFMIDKNTSIRRGENVVAAADAKITVGERIAVIVVGPAKDPAAARELRLGLPAKSGAAAGQKPPPAAAHVEHQAPAAQHAGHQMPSSSPGWHVMQDGAVYGLFNQQGGPRGGREFVVPNWWMGMAMREKGRHQISLNGMFSLDAATVGKEGYREIFQVGEALDGKPLIDHQHPHDFFMQLAAAWRIALPKGLSFTLSGGPVGEPTLGPIAFMHRPSASGLLLAPLGHHTFDSTHISFGVVAAAIERGPVTVEASLFNGREPDEHRWDFDLDRMDSYAARVWFRPSESWEFQVSSGKLVEPEELEEGNVVRTTTSGSWFTKTPTGLRAATVGYGVNRAHGVYRHGGFGEFTVERQPYSFSGRLDVQQVETHLLLTGEIPDDDHGPEPAQTVTALTLGGTRQLMTWRGFEGDVGAHVTFYRVPEILKSTHGSNPVSFQLFFRLRLPTGGSDRMWNMRMSRVHQMTMDHSGHAK
jgi:hypothetical protein